MVNLVHSDGTEFYPVDYRVYAPTTDGKTKHHHFQEMLQHAKADKQIQAQTVLFDSWYASVTHLKLRVQLGLYFVTTLKNNRLVSLSKTSGYVHLDTLTWSPEQLTDGILN